MTDAEIQDLQQAFGSLRYEIHQLKNTVERQNQRIVQLEKFQKEVTQAARHMPRGRAIAVRF